MEVTLDDLQLFLTQLDQHRANFLSYYTRYTTGIISENEFISLVERLFILVYIDYEKFVKSVFLFYIYYSLEKVDVVLDPLLVVLKPRSFEHLKDILKGRDLFFDFSSFDKVNDVCKRYLPNNHILSDAFAMRKNRFNYYQLVRNQLCHDSLESMSKFRSHVENYIDRVAIASLNPFGKVLITVETKQASVLKKQQLILNMIDDFSDLARIILS